MLAFSNSYGDGAATGAPTTYTVQRGDTLGRIARKIYGDARKYPLIQQANKINNPSRIWVGQVLIIPALNNGLTTTTTPSTPTTPQPPPTPPVSPQPTSVVAKPAARWVGSPNFNRRRSPNDITGITIHSTANSNLEGVVRWFNNPNAQVSAHYTIGKDGAIVQHVRDQDRALGTPDGVPGRGALPAMTTVWALSWSTSMTAWIPYPAAQHQANVNLCAYLCQTYNIRPDNIMGHFEIAIPLGRKSDPRNYDLSRLPT